MPRFSSKDLMITTTLIAVGMLLIYVAYQAYLHPDFSDYAALRFSGGVFGGTALIGAGMLTPFKRPWTGAIVAVSLVFLLMLVLPFSGVR
jgi:hypothetical protein